MISVLYKLIIFTGDVVMSPVGTGGDSGDPGIQLANALAACILSNKLAHSHRQWAASQLVKIINFKHLLYNDS